MLEIRPPSSPPEIGVSRSDSFLDGNALYRSDSYHGGKDSGGADYVTKPFRPQEVLARIAAHMQNARQMKQARSALDAFGQATIAMRAGDGQLLWQTPLARRLLSDYFNVPDGLTPTRLIDWLIEAQQAACENRESPLLASLPNRRLLASLHDPSKPGQEGEADEKEWLLVLREENHQAAISSLIATFRLTQREAEVLFWVCKGKTNKDIGEILNTSSRTVNKHLEHVFEKLGVETRTAAANLALNKIGMSVNRK